MRAPNSQPFWREGVLKFGIWRFLTWFSFMTFNDKRILKQGPRLIEIELPVLHDRACYVLVWGVATRLAVRRGPGGPETPL